MTNAERIAYTEVPGKINFKRLKELGKSLYSITYDKINNNDRYSKRFENVSYMASSEEV